MYILISKLIYEKTLVTKAVFYHIGKGEEAEMDRFIGDSDDHQFIFWSVDHVWALAALGLLIIGLFILKGRSVNTTRCLWLEKTFAVTLLIIEGLYHMWLFTTEQWHFRQSLPLELCSLSLMVTIVLLWTGNRYLYQFVLFAGIGGAIQAMLTPVMEWSFPHFRYFHFFYTHIGIIITALYFTWVKGYRPTLRGIGGTMLTLNILLPFIWLINDQLGGNYMFLREKPGSGSVLDLLGPYPWYILSMEVVALGVFFILWNLLRGNVKKI